MKKTVPFLILLMTSLMFLTGCSGGAASEDEKNSGFDNSKPVPAED